MGPLFIVVSAPSLHFLLGVRKGQEPVSVEAFGPEAAVEGLDERVVGRFAGPREVQRDAALVGPQVKITRHKLAALIDADRCREPHFLAGPFQHLHDVGAAEGEPRRQGRREAGEGIDNREHAQLVSGRQLVMDEVHRPGLVRSCGRAAIIAQLGLDPALRRFVA